MKYKVGDKVKITGHKGQKIKHCHKVGDIGYIQNFSDIGNCKVIVDKLPQWVEECDLKLVKRGRPKMKKLSKKLIKLDSAEDRSDKAVKDYLERAKVFMGEPFEVEYSSQVIEIAKLIQREEQV